MYCLSLAVFKQYLIYMYYIPLTLLTINYIYNKPKATTVPTCDRLSLPWLTISAISTPYLLRRVCCRL